MNVLLVSRVLMLVLQSAYHLSQHLWPECHRTEHFHPQKRKEKKKKRKDYAFRRYFNEKPSIIPGCPGSTHSM